MTAMDLRAYIRSIPDFPVPGVLFRDITPLLQAPAAFQEAVRRLAEPFAGAGITAVVGAEARGFIFGVPVAQALGAAFVPIRKQGRLPYRTYAREYELEYGRAVLEIHQDAFKDGLGARVLLVDDVLATGGTAAACLDLIRLAGGQPVAAAFLIELAALGGRERLKPLPTHAVIVY